MLTGNKGEWSEVYTLLRVISDQRLFGGDKDLNRVESLVFPVLKILRDEFNHQLEFTYDSEDVVVKTGSGQHRVALCEFKEKAESLLSKLSQTTSATFALPEIENFIRSFECTSLKASSSVKSDIRIVIHDHRTGTTPELGFSIKSQLGGASTLLNAGKTTNFIFRIREPDLTNEQITDINAINSRSKIKDRLEAINANSAGLEFVKT